MTYKDDMKSQQISTKDTVTLKRYACRLDLARCAASLVLGSFNRRTIPAGNYRVWDSNTGWLQFREVFLNQPSTLKVFAWCELTREVLAVAMAPDPS